MNTDMVAQTTPFTENLGRHPDVLADAAYGLITATHSQMSVELRQVSVDSAALSRHVEASGMPHGVWWFNQRRQL